MICHFETKLLRLFNCIHQNSFDFDSFLTSYWQQQWTVKGEHLTWKPLNLKHQKAFPPQDSYGVIVNAETTGFVSTLDMEMPFEYNVIGSPTPYDIE